MVRLIVFSLLALAVSGEAEFCHKQVRKWCGAIDDKITNCNASYSGANHINEKNELSLMVDLNHYTATHLHLNFQFLLMSAYFNNYQANREGLSKLYRKLADDAWEDSIDLIKYTAKRGFNTNFKIHPKWMVESFSMHELESLGTALDMQKVLAEEAHNIHRSVSVHKTRHDAEAMQYIEKKFVSKHADTIRDLAGHFNDLQQLIDSKDSNVPKDPSLAIYLFDEHLKKVLA